MKGSKMRAKISCLPHLESAIFVLIMAGCMAVGLSPAQAQEYVAEPIVPQPDVWAYVSQYPFMKNLYGQQAAGQYKSLTIFGDSYADWGNTLKASGVSPPPPTYPDGRLSNGMSMGDALEYHYALPTSSVYNYAVGGAATGTANAFNTLYPGGYTLPGTATEIQTFLDSGGHFNESDLVDLTTAGGNDGLLLQQSYPNATGAQITAAAVQTSANFLSDVKNLVGAGARNLTVLSPPDMSLMPYGAGNSIYHSFYSQIFPMISADLAPIARSGVRVFYFDMTTLQQRVLANPGLYGFINPTQDCLAVASCANGTVAQQDQYFSWDGEHLTNAGYALLSRYETNQVDAPSTIAAQGELGMIGARAFSDSVFSRLDDDRSLDGSQAPGDNGSPLSVYLQGTDITGSQNDQMFALGMNYSAPGVSVGVDYHASPNLLLGAAFNYSTPQASLNQGFGNVKINTEKLALYGSWSSAGYFLDFAGVAGHDNYTISRPGVIDNINGKTSGPDAVVAVRAGNLLLGNGDFRAGPILELNYATVRENGYTESGDWLLTQSIAAQTLNSFIGSVGMQLRLNLPMRGSILNSYINLTANHAFLNPVRFIVTSQLSTPAIVDATPVVDAGNQTYGQIVAGLSFRVANNLAINSSFGTQFGSVSRPANFSVAGGLSYRF